MKALSLAGCVLLCAVMGCMIGCQDAASTAGKKDNAPAITGTVYLGDKVVNYGEVMFIRTDGKTRKAAIAPDGSYRIREPYEGENKIIVVTGQPPVAAAAAGAKGPPPSFKRITLPEKYSSEEKTDLKYVVKPGSHTFDIKMLAEDKEMDQAGDKGTGKVNEKEKK